MKINTTLATVVAVSLMGSALCHAQDAAASKIQMHFKIVDTDKNGSISFEEFKAKTQTPELAEEKFARTDTNKNGSLSLKEWMARGTGQVRPVAE